MLILWRCENRGNGHQDLSPRSTSIAVAVKGPMVSVFAQLTAMGLSASGTAPFSTNPPVKKNTSALPLSECAYTEDRGAGPSKTDIESPRCRPPLNRHAGGWVVSVGINTGINHSNRLQGNQSRGSSPYKGYLKKSASTQKAKTLHPNTIDKAITLSGMAYYAQKRMHNK